MMPNTMASESPFSQSSRPHDSQSPHANSPKRRRVDRSSSVIETTSGPRPTQRAPKSCLECTRRKIRCDKKQPCKACMDRGEAAECRREAVYVKGAIISGDLSQKAISLENLAGEIELLKKRVLDLEENGSQRVNDNGSNLYSQQADIQASSRQTLSDVDQGRLPGTMEEIALGIGESTRWKGASLLNSKPEAPSSAAQWYQPIAFETSLSAVPSRPNCHTLVTFYLEEVAWTCCAIHGPTFIVEHETFWRRLEKSELRDDLWLALLFAVLSISAFFMDENQAAARGFTFHHLKTAGTVWFDSAIATIFRCGIWTQPLLLTCQILQVLSPAFHLTGNTNLHQSLTGLERTQIRSINLHLLGSHKEDSQKDLIRKEVGRRIWWNNVESDWIFIPYNRYAQFPPHQFTTAMPEISDESCPISDGSLSLAYRVACYKSARLIYDVYGHLGPSEDPSYDRIVSASQAYDNLRSELPSELRFDRQERSAYGLFLVEITRRRLLALVLAYRSYQLHRLFFVKSLTDSRYALSRRACLEAADTITAVADLGLPRIYFQLWNVTVSLVAAGIILAFQLLQMSSTQPSLVQQRLRIQTLVERLRTLDDRSGIASRGAIFIAYLLQVELEISNGHRTEVKFTRASIMDLVQAGPAISSPQTAPVIHQHNAVHHPFLANDQHGSFLPQEQLYDTGIPALSYPAEFDLATLLNDFMSTA